MKWILEVFGGSLPMMADPRIRLYPTSVFDLCQRTSVLHQIVGRATLRGEVSSQNHSSRHIVRSLRWWIELFVRSYPHSSQDGLLIQNSLPLANARADLQSSALLRLYQARACEFANGSELTFNR